MKIFRAKAGEDASNSLGLGEVERIEATGNFRYTSLATVVTGDKGVYERAKDIITITGKVRVKQNSGSEATTDKLMYNVKTEALRFAGECAGAGCGPRPTVRIGNGN